MTEWTHWSIDLGIHWPRQWLVAWRHQAITSPIADFSSYVFCGIREICHKTFFSTQSVTCIRRLHVHVPKEPMSSKLPNPSSWFCTAAVKKVQLKYTVYSNNYALCIDCAWLRYGIMGLSISHSAKSLIHRQSSSLLDACSFCLLAPLCDHRSLSNLQQSNTRAWYALHQNDRLVPFLVFVHWSPKDSPRDDGRRKAGTTVA